MKELEENCCFYCKHYRHLNPDDDGCELTGEIVYFDSHICENYVRYTENE